MIYLNNKPINVTMFPDGTSQVWKLPKEGLSGQFATITWEFETEAEFLHLAQLKSLLDEEGLDSYLKITYLPYARQDKEVSNYSTFALHSFASLLNSLKFRNILINDPHSDKYKQIENSAAMYPMVKLEEALKDSKANLICYPDQGAAVKYANIYGKEFTIPVMYGQKTRDQSNGVISDYRIYGAPPKEQNILIVDDICDGGATFIRLSKLLYDSGAEKVSLFVTHGLFTKGRQILLDADIKNIYTG